MGYTIGIISFLIFLLGKLTSKKGIKDRELQRPFECGFSTLTEQRIPFSIHFFLVALVFAIFDVEILILFPIVTNFNYRIWSSLIIYQLLILFLTLGLVNE